MPPVHGTLKAGIVQFTPRVRWFIPESVFYMQPIMLSPRFIPESVFCTQSVMLSPRFMPRSVFYTVSAVRSQPFILADRKITIYKKYCKGRSDNARRVNIIRGWPTPAFCRFI